MFSGAVDFSSAKTVAEIIAQLQVRKLAPDLVVIGTLARNFGQGDENSVRDMVSFISNVERLAEAFGAHVIIVHHTGKDRTKNARGSSALNAAVSTEIKVTNASGKSVVIGVCAQLLDAFPPDLHCKHRAEQFPTEADRLMADVDASFVYQVFGISKRKRKPDIHHHRKADDLWARKIGSDVPKWTAFCHLRIPGTSAR